MLKIEQFTLKFNDAFVGPKMRGKHTDTLH